VRLRSGEVGILEMAEKGAVESPFIYPVKPRNSHRRKRRYGVGELPKSGFGRYI